MRLEVVSSNTLLTPLPRSRLRALSAGDNITLQLPDVTPSYVSHLFLGNVTANSSLVAKPFSKVPDEVSFMIELLGRFITSILWDVRGLHEPTLTDAISRR